MWRICGLSTVWGKRTNDREAIFPPKHSPLRLCCVCNQEINDWAVPVVLPHCVAVSGAPLLLGSQSPAKENQLLEAGGAALFVDVMAAIGAMARRRRVV